MAREADERVEAWIHRAGVKVVDVERDLGLRESKIYRFFRGAEHFRAAWLELLPPNIELLYLAERAAHHGRELVHVGDENRGSTFVELVHELSDVTRAASESERDGEVDGRRAWTKTHLGESPLNKAEAVRGKSPRETHVLFVSTMVELLVGWLRREVLLEARRSL